MRKAIVIRHLSFEDEALFASPLRAAGFELEWLDAGIDALAPALRAELVLVMGGPISVNDVHAYPWLQDEIAVLQARLHAGKATLGICLGAQLMARALGAQVHAGTREIGLFPLQLTDAGRNGLLADYRDAPLMFHWHGETFELPEGATLLASTTGNRNQVFAYGKHALAFQCHPEVDPDQLERWLIGHAVELGVAGIDPASLRAPMQQAGAELKRKGQAMLQRWLRQLGYLVH